MSNGKLKYSEPIITRVKLDPEQAVLTACDEYSEPKLNCSASLCLLVVSNTMIEACTKGGTTGEEAGSSVETCPS